MYNEFGLRRVIFGRECANRRLKRREGVRESAQLTADAQRSD